MRGWAVWAASLTVVLLFNPGAQPSVRFSQRGRQVLFPDVILCTITPICVLIALAEMGAAGQKVMAVAERCWLGAARLVPLRQGHRGWSGLLRQSGLLGDPDFQALPRHQNSAA